MAFLVRELIRLATNEPKEKFIHVELLLPNLKKSDMIEIDHKSFCHWVLYIGDGTVIHLTNSRQPITDSNEVNDLIDSDKLRIIYKKRHLKLKNCTKGMVKMEPLIDIAKNYKCRVNNKELRALKWALNRKQEFKRFNDNEVVKRARLMVSQAFGDYIYEFKESNCEHFCTFWKYNLCESDQVNKALKILYEVPSMPRNFFETASDALMGAFRMALFFILFSYSLETFKNKSIIKIINSLNDQKSRTTKIIFQNWFVKQYNKPFIFPSLSQNCNKSVNNKTLNRYEEYTDDDFIYDYNIYNEEDEDKEEYEIAFKDKIHDEIELEDKFEYEIENEIEDKIKEVEKYVTEDSDDDFYINEDDGYKLIGTILEKINSSLKFIKMCLEDFDEFDNYNDSNDEVKNFVKVCYNDYCDFGKFEDEYNRYKSFVLKVETLKSQLKTSISSFKISEEYFNSVDFNKFYSIINELDYEVEIMKLQTIFVYNSSIVNYSDKTDKNKIKFKYNQTIGTDMLINVKSMTGKTIPLQVNSNEPIWSVKEKILKEYGVKPYQQRLIYGSKPLRDDLILSDYNIKKDTNINLVLRLHGGNDTKA